MDEKELQKNLEEIFRRASEEATQRAEEYFNKFKERDKKMLAKVKSGEMTKREYDLWKKNQILAGEKWNSLVDELSNQLAKADETAREEINGSLPSFLAEGMNQALYEAETLGGLSGSFGLVDKNTAVYLAKNNPELLPSLKPESDTAKQIREGKLKRWNQQHITSEITQGVILGESMDKVAKRLKNVADMDKRAAMRNARTATGAAVNAGKIEGMKRNEERGVPTEKMWSAILDTRTRHEHRDLDGQIKKLDEPFESSEGYKLMYPRDPNGDACMIYNCRCKVVSVPTKIKDMILDMYDREGQIINTYDAEGNIVKAQSYEEWKNEKKKTAPKKPKEEKKEPEVKDAVIEPKQAVSEPQPFKSDKLRKAMKKKDYEEFAEVVENSPLKQTYSALADKTKLEWNKSDDAYYRHSRYGGTVVAYGIEADGRNKYSVLAHEYGHAFSHRNFDAQATYKEISKLNYNLDLSRIKKQVAVSDEFLGAMRKDIALYDDKSIAKFYAKVGMWGEESNASNGVQDFFDGAFSAMKKHHGWGHGDEYYDRQYTHMVDYGEFGINTLKKIDSSIKTVEDAKRHLRQYDTASELWANINSAVTVGGKELDYIKKYTPNSYAKFMEIIERNNPT